MEPCKMTSYSYTPLSEEVKPTSYNTKCTKLLEAQEGGFKFPIGHPLFYQESLDLSHWKMLISSIRSRNVDTELLRCLLSMRDSSILHIQPGANRVSIITQKLRVTFADQLSAFGRF